MSNTILTPTAVTREALRILHQKASFIGSINRSYDDQYAKEGAKIGSTLKVRLPNQYTVRTGAVMAAQDTTETSVDLTVATQKGVDLRFTSADLTLSLDDFSKRILEPAMSVLAAHIEADALSMYKSVYQISDQDATAFTTLSVGQAREVLGNALCPLSDRSILLQNSSMTKLANSVATYFNDPKEVSKTFREGLMGRNGGFDFYESSLVLPHLTGTAAKTTGYTVSGANQTGSTVTVTGGTTTFLVGDIITLAGCYRVHPETKANTGVLQQFVITANSGASATSLSISPAIVTSGARQNVSASPTDTGAVVKVAAGANEYIQGNLAYHKDAFAFATADLIMPSGVDFKAREVMDGISMRIVRNYDINNDQMPCRIDVLYGYKAIRPELACRIHADG